MEQQELESMMQQMFADAQTNAKNMFDIELDGSEASLVHVDEIIAKVIIAPEHNLEDDKLMFTLSHMLGGYVGEVFRINHGGQWHYDTSDEKAPAVFLLKNEASYAFSGMVFQCLQQQSTLSMQQYYQHAVNQTHEH